MAVPSLASVVMDPLLGMVDTGAALMVLHCHRQACIVPCLHSLEGLQMHLLWRGALASDILRSSVLLAKL